MASSVLKRRFIATLPVSYSLLLASALSSVLASAACSRDSSPSSMNTPSTSSSSTTPSGAPSGAERDVHSFAVPAEARVTHVALDLRADFSAKRLTGKATLDLQRAPNAKQ